MVSDLWIRFFMVKMYLTTLKERMMMKIIWGSLIILYCFVSVAIGQETIGNLTAPDTSAPVFTYADVDIEKNGFLTFQAGNSLLEGEISLKVTEKVTLLSGDYAGWGYAHIEYKAGKLKGSIFYVFNNNEGRGMLIGDLVGVARQKAGLESDMTWNISSLEGENIQANIDLAFAGYKAGKLSRHEDVWVPVLSGYELTTDGYSQTTTVLLLPAPNGNPHHVRKFKGCGLEFGTYDFGTHSGSVWSFVDNTETVEPFSQRRYGTRDGVLAGTSEVYFDRSGGGKSAINNSTLVAE